MDTPLASAKLNAVKGAYQEQEECPVRAQELREEAARLKRAGQAAADALPAVEKEIAKLQDAEQDLMRRSTEP